MRLLNNDMLISTPLSTPLKLNSDQVFRILVCHVSRIGDTILITPAIRLLAEQFPQAKIDFLGHPRRYKLLFGIPYLNYVGSINKQRAPFRGWLSAIGKRKIYDLAVIWGHDEQVPNYACRVSKWVLMQSLADTKKNIRLQKKGCLIADIGDAPNSLSAPNESLISWRLKLLEKGLFPNIKSYAIKPADYVVLENEKDWASKFIKENFEGDYLIGLVVNTHPVGKVKNFPKREWPIEYYGELCKNILSLIPNARFILFGDKHSRSSTLPLAQFLGKQLYLMVDKLTLRQSAAIIEQLNLYIGGDTGPTHMAVALKIPTIAFFHCYLHGRMVFPLPQDNKTLIIDHPCNKEKDIFSAPMSDILLASVWQKVKPFIGH